MRQLCTKCNGILEDLPLFTSITKVCRRCEATKAPKQLDLPFPKVSSDGLTWDELDSMSLDDFIKDLEKGVKVAYKDFHLVWAPGGCNTGELSRGTVTFYPKYAPTTKESNNE